MTELPSTSAPARRDWKAKTVARVREHIERAEVELQVVTDLLDTLESPRPAPIPAVTGENFERHLARRLAPSSDLAADRPIPAQLETSGLAGADAGFTHGGMTPPAQCGTQMVAQLSRAEHELANRLESLETTAGSNLGNSEGSGSSAGTASTPGTQASATTQPPHSPAPGSSSHNVLAKSSSTPFRQMSAAPENASAPVAATEVDSLASSLTNSAMSAKPSDTTSRSGSGRIAATTEPFLSGQPLGGGTSQPPAWFPAGTLATPAPDSSVPAPPAVSTTTQPSVQDKRPSATKDADLAVAQPPRPEAAAVDLPPPAPIRQTATVSPQTPATHSADTVADTLPAHHQSPENQNQAPKRHSKAPVTQGAEGLADAAEPPAVASTLGVQALQESPHHAKYNTDSLDAVVRAETITAESEAASGDSWARLRADLSRVGDDLISGDTSGNDLVDVDAGESPRPADKSADDDATRAPAATGAPEPRPGQGDGAGAQSPTAGAEPRQAKIEKPQAPADRPQRQEGSAESAEVAVPQQFDPQGSDAYRLPAGNELVGRWQHAALSAWSEAGYQGVIETVPGAKRLGIVAEAGKYATLQGRTTLFVTDSIAAVHTHTVELSHLLPDLKIGKVTTEERNDLAALDMIVCTAEHACQEQVTRALPGAAFLVAENPTRVEMRHLETLASHRAFDWRLALNDSLDPLDSESEATLKKHFGDVNANLTYPRCVDDGTVNAFRVALVGVPLSPSESTAYSEANAHLKQSMSTLASLGIAETAPAIYWHYIKSLSSGAGEPEAQKAAREYLAANTRRNSVLADSESKMAVLQDIAPYLGKYRQCVAFVQNKSTAQRTTQVLAQAQVKAMGLVASDPISAPASEATDTHVTDTGAQNKVLPDNASGVSADLGIILAASQSRAHLRQRMAHLIRTSHATYPSTLIVLYATGTVEDPLLAKNVGAYVQELSLVAQSSFEGSSHDLDAVKHFLQSVS